MKSRIEHARFGSRVSLPSRWRRVAFALLLAIASAGAGDATASDVIAGDIIAHEEVAAEEPVRARLVCDRVAIEPSGVMQLGLLFDIDPGWHLFWDGCNDTGYPIDVRTDLPEGFTAGDLLWPAPERLVSPGGILDHVYAEQVLLILPADVPGGLDAGASVTLACALEWVSCREACLIGGAAVSLSLPVAGRDAPAPSEHAPLFERARARLPKTQAASAASYRSRFDGEAVIVEAAGADSIVFFPQSGCEALADPLADCAASGSRLSMRVRQGNHAAHAGDAPDTLRGVLEIRTRTPAPQRFMTVEFPLSNSTATH